jgi:hypothetical protein
MPRFVARAVTVLLCGASRVCAQSADTVAATAVRADSTLPQARTTASAPRGVVTVSPFTVLMQYLRGDVEWKVGEVITLGAGGGVAYLDENGAIVQVGRRRRTNPSLSSEISYQWLVGTDHR